MRKQKHIVLLAGLAIFAVFLAACSTASPAAEASAVPESAIVETEAPSAMEAAVETTAEPVEAAAEAPRPTPRAGLEASDPGTVALASGSYQLIEFFAYW